RFRSSIALAMGSGTILPSVVLSLIVGIGSLKRDSARAIAVKAGLVLLLFWAIGVGIFFSLE
ncbi:hypothetical protein, partial [Providencia stuartii]|uniref:hypothetical protein n=1 Tax=Providencia stuartii TaxID=588 RepID=UPI001953498B